MTDPSAYHFDLREKAGPRPEDGVARFRALAADPARANPVSIVQLGLGSLQLRDPARLPLVAEVVAWVEARTDRDGLLPYRFPMPHTYPLAPPWHSALAQGEAASLAVRAAAALARPELLALARRLAAPLLDPASPLVVETPEGPVLQEYPTRPPAHVLNGWIASLWGLHDAGERDAFAAGAAAVAARIDRYRTPLGWSRYDLYPHPLVNVASPSYHRLHVGHLRALHALAPDPRLAAAADDWARAARNPVALAFALGRKVAFRVVLPRSRPVRV
jgi:hypothetical protein